EIRLDQSPAVVKKPGETVISCKISGYSMTSYNIHWIRQKPGKTLEWLGWMSTGNNRGTYADAVKGRFTISRDNSKMQVYLQMNSMKTEDTAVYYCARDPHSYYMHWIRQKPGRGLEWIGLIYTGTSTTFAQYNQVFSSTDVHGEELTQPASMTVQPGQSLSINCKVSYSVTSYTTSWIRQPAGKALEWIGYISNGGSLDYSDKLKNKFSISRDTSTNTITIQGQNMQTEDTAMYYC
ncbi:Ig heavy chain V region 914, partial [Silurus meridionalis]